MAHDFLGNELSIGDYVVFLNYNVTSASLERGIITRVSEHTAEIGGKRRAEYKIVKVNPVKSTMDNTWIPCSERLSEENQRVLFWNPSNEAIYAGFYSYTGKRGTAWFRAGKSDYASKYWMPLPEPPKEELP